MRERWREGRRGRERERGGGGDGGRAGGGGESEREKGMVYKPYWNACQPLHDLSYVAASQSQHCPELYLQLSEMKNWQQFHLHSYRHVQ